MLREARRDFRDDENWYYFNMVLTPRIDILEILDRELREQHGLTIIYKDGSSPREVAVTIVPDELPLED